MISEWMKVMLEEIAGKKAQAEQARAEERQRAAESQGRVESRGRAELQGHADLPNAAAQSAPARPGADSASG
jgi:hypothetical protein